MIQPSHHPEWNTSLERSRSYSVFHTAQWANVLEKTYSYQPNYLIEERDGAFTTLVPLMEIDSFITGRRAVSLPFTDACPLLVSESTSIQQLFTCIKEMGKDRKWKYVELRPDTEIDLPGVSHATCFGHRADITKKNLFSSFQENTRRNIRKSEKNGVNVLQDNSIDGVRKFYGLHCITRKKHGVPPQPFHFFKNIGRFLIEEGLGNVFLAYKGNDLIAGAIFLRFHDKVMYKFGASLSEYQHLRSNNAVMWSAFQYYASQNVLEIDLGRTEMDNPGLRRFKLGWNTSEQVLKYYRFDFSDKNHHREIASLPGNSQHLFRTLPIPVLRLAGILAYRHMG
jgi:CelD/BcsL family acetyltransferase involved in cellulose biosynthesis